MIDWKRTQAALGVTPDGIPGRATYAAIFKLVGPSASPGTLKSLGNAMAVHGPIYGAINSRDRLADFLAQTANETGGYQVFTENLNYSAAALSRTWPSRFTPDSAAQYARKPELIAQRVYGDRMGNLSPAEGWLFRGRGMLQLTGRANYEAADKRLGIGLDTDPDLAAVPALSLLIALDFYRDRKVWERLDAGDPTGARRITNGGTIGLDHVNALRAKALEVLA
jgi:putative chitinase